VFASGVDPTPSQEALRGTLNRPTACGWKPRSARNVAALLLMVVPSIPINAAYAYDTRVTRAGA